MKTVLITGCGAGIGLALAREYYANAEYRVVVTARAHSLAELAQEFSDPKRSMVRELDMTKDETMYALINEICCNWGRIDILINNAAVCFRGVVEHMDVDAEMLQLKTNYLGPMALIRAVLPIMREQRSGHIINISSVAGMMAMPTMASYSASKHALEGATEALWFEAKPYGIRVNIVELGFIKSNSFENVRLSKKAMLSSQLRGPHSEYYRSMEPFIRKLMRWSRIDPQAVARKIERLANQPGLPLRIAVTPDAIFFGLLKRWTPARFFHRILFYLLPNSAIWGSKRGVDEKSLAA